MNVANLLALFNSCTITSLACLQIVKHDLVLVDLTRTNTHRDIPGVVDSTLVNKESLWNYMHNCT